MMKIDILTLFPEMFQGPLNESIIGKAQSNGIVDFNLINFRDFSENKHHQVDDTTYGGGAGMLLMPQPIFDAMDYVEQKSSGDRGHVILLDPAGKCFSQRDAVNLSHQEHLTFICGHYEGYDERIKTLVDEEYSIGDYVLTGGELGAMVMLDAIIRLLPGVLGNDESSVDESFTNGLLEYPQYTRPANFRGMQVPEVLTNGNHQLIDEWREKESLRKTYQRRPDLLKKISLSAHQRKILKDIKRNYSNELNE